MKETDIVDFEGYSFAPAMELLAHAIKSIAKSGESNEVRVQAYKQLDGCLRGLESLYDDDSFDTILELRHMMPDALMEKCVYLSEDWGEKSDVIQLLGRIIEATPYFAPAYLLRAKIHQESGNETAFQKDLEEFISFIPRDYKDYEVLEYPLMANIFADNPTNISKAIFDEAILYCSLVIEHFEAKIGYWPYFIRFCLYYFRYLNFGLPSDLSNATDDLRRALILHPHYFIEEFPSCTVSAFVVSEKPLDFWVSHISSSQWKQLLLPIIEEASDDYYMAYILLANIYLKLDKDEKSAFIVLSDLRNTLDKDDYFFEQYGENLEGLIDRTL
jgi:hypothetical protein